MTRKNTGMLLGILGLVLGSTFFTRCGGEDVPEIPGQVSLPTENPFGGYTMDCNDSPPSQPPQQQQQQQVKFSPERQQGCVPEFQFHQERLADFIIVLDCDAKLVVIKTHEPGREARHNGPDPVQAEFPIDADGKVYGQMKFKQPVQNDSFGSGACWVDYFVTFSGTAQCDDRRGGGEKVDLTTHVQFAPTDPRDIPEPGPAGGNLPGLVPPPDENSPQPGISPLPDSEPSPEIEPSPSPNPSPSPSPTVSPSPSPTQRPTRSPRPSPTPTPTVTPRPSATATVMPVLTCVLQNPCPLISKTELSCPAQQR